ncbi:putative 5' nucleotidase family protein [Monocercomonoides exilis]|uniref:putative 5' nucleotidase family protein n=1 Tax=Monocercomonoides exilis TaxID=2049356 RepID=UPI00355A2161|nr:putative 5' nucleotidase family protein [Monocercomonoides exilis]|eukprot:MONOS_4267.1-p1 / transcript=MONOS_4267.1 / gene=MONOS_4267 / organism=Monocercomonoides_exilis_PA203 / gene_product=5' nucleotidase family protein / transcript_product=5' nucleotidase family protein / location=Mono_scaffold00111:59411-61634(+) / protein_length=677 / sequence_SO=supercontig / SO=protein_coding / is_pseudo=false
MIKNVIIVVYLFTFFIDISICNETPQQYHFTVFHTNDVHGWANGKPHEKYFDGSLADYENLIWHSKNKANSTHIVLSFDSGDWTVGTGLSDGTPIPGSFMFELAFNMSLDAWSMGTHEFYSENTVRFINQNVTKLLGERYLAGNTKMKNTSAPIANTHIIKDFPGFGKVAIFSFMYTWKPPTDVAFITDMKIALTESHYVDTIQNKEVKFAIVLAHLDPGFEEATQIIDDIHSKRPDVPVLYLGANTHFENVTHKGNGKQLRIQSGGFFYQIGKIDFDLIPSKDADEAQFSIANEKVVFIPTNVAEMKKAAGFAEHSNSSPQSSQKEGLAAYSEDEWETENGKKMREATRAQVSQLGLDDVMGCSPQTYYKFQNASLNESLYNLLLNTVYPSINPYPRSLDKKEDRMTYEQWLEWNRTNGETSPAEQAPKCTITVYASNYATQRTSMFEGSVSMDDVISIDPFNYKLCSFRDLKHSHLQMMFNSDIESANSAECEEEDILCQNNSPHKHSFSSSGITRSPSDSHHSSGLFQQFRHSNDILPFVDRMNYSRFIHTDVCEYDIISSTYDCKRMQDILNKILPSQYFYLTHPSQKRTREVWLEYMRSYMQCPLTRKGDHKRAAGYIGSGIALLILVFLYFASLWIYLELKRYHRKIAYHRLKNKEGSMMTEIRKNSIKLS